MVTNRIGLLMMAVMGSYAFIMCQLCIAVMGYVCFCFRI